MLATLGLSLPSLCAAMPDPAAAPVALAATLTLATVLTLSLRARSGPWLWRLASLARRSRTTRSSSRTRRFRASFSRFTLSSSAR